MPDYWLMVPMPCGNAGVSLAQFNGDHTKAHFTTTIPLVNQYRSVSFFARFQ